MTLPHANDPSARRRTTPPTNGEASDDRPPPRPATSAPRPVAPRPPGGSVAGAIGRGAAVAVLVIGSLVSMLVIDAARPDVDRPDVDRAATATVPPRVPALPLPTTVPSPTGTPENGAGSPPTTTTGRRPVLHQPDCSVDVGLGQTMRTPERLALVSESLSALAAAGGFEFSVSAGGATDITIEWAGIDDPGVLGRTTNRYVGDEIGSAEVTIEPDLGDNEPPVVMHELIHALGGGHSDAPGDLMFPELQPGRSGDLSAGDRAVVAQLGQLAGCGR